MTLVRIVQDFWINPLLSPSHTASMYPAVSSLSPLGCPCTHSTPWCPKLPAFHTARRPPPPGSPDTGSGIFCPSRCSCLKLGVHSCLPTASPVDSTSSLAVKQVQLPPSSGPLARIASGLTLTGDSVLLRASCPLPQLRPRLCHSGLSKMQI